VNPVEDQLRALMCEALAGNGASYRVLLDRLSGHLRSYFARRLGSAPDVEDLVQETLTAVHVRRATYEPDRPLTPWLYAIARYKLIDHLRRQRLRPAVPIDEAEFLSTGDHGDAVAAQLDVERMLDGLPQRSRTLIRQVKIEGQSVAAAAAQSGLTPSAAKVTIHRGLKTLAARFQKRHPRDVDE
jgi:RNA polymerase sigma-70 factor (ECF subfamily)